MSASFTALWLLGSAASATFAAKTEPDHALLTDGVLIGRVLIGAVLGFTLGFVVMPQPEWLGLLIGCFAFFELTAERRRFAAMTAGFLGGIGGHILKVDGPSLIVAAALSLAVPLIAARLSERAGFAPPRLREQALCLLVFASAVVASLRELNTGWRAAVNLNRTVASHARSLPDWSWQLVLGALVLGAIRSLWVRR